MIIFLLLILSIIIKINNIYNTNDNIFNTNTFNNNKNNNI